MEESFLVGEGALLASFLFSVMQDSVWSTDFQPLKCHDDFNYSRIYIFVI